MTLWRAFWDFSQGQSIKTALMRSNSGQLPLPLSQDLSKIT
uniref:Uncharacterized protein n=1 Tax=Anguilla anguilla TaxID=7936 RepID=A0A0E9UKD2_ANGAN